MSRYSVPEMSCGHCRAKIEAAVLDADEGAGLDFDMEAREIEIDSVLETSEIVAVMEAAGYPATEIV